MPGKITDAIILEIIPKKIFGNVSNFALHEFLKSSNKLGYAEFA